MNIEELGEFIAEKSKLPNKDDRSDAATHALRNLKRLKEQIKANGSESEKAQLKTLFDRMFTELLADWYAANPTDAPPNFETWWAK